ncbi:hypothetical protein LY78DRAFT_736647 [Colletotrichum sublineola]|nr:hypothetical protein LY78DRAFT_736647 [Colletotrichum sublineola]
MGKRGGRPRRGKLLATSGEVSFGYVPSKLAQNWVTSRGDVFVMGERGGRPRRGKLLATSGEVSFGYVPSKLAQNWVTSRGRHTRRGRRNRRNRRKRRNRNNRINQVRRRGSIPLSQGCRDACRGCGHVRERSQSRSSSIARRRMRSTLRSMVSISRGGGVQEGAESKEQSEETQATGGEGKT